MTSWLARVFGRNAPTTSPAPSVTRPGDPEHLTSVERRRASERARQERQREQRLIEGGVVAESERRGLVRGRHYTEWPDVVRELKQDGRLDEALDLLMECVGAAERDAGSREPAPWYTEQAAIVLRKLGRRDDEVAVLERWVAAAGDPGRWVGSTQPRLVARLAKLRGEGGARPPS